MNAQAAATALHQSPHRGVLAITGGGSGALAALLQQPGASATVLEAVVPYAEASLAEWLRGRVDSACSEATARAMAVASYERARKLIGRDEFDGRFEDDPNDSGDLFGLGCTASLATSRPKRGDHRIHVAVQTPAASHVWSLELAKGERDRSEEETLATRLVLFALSRAVGLEGVTEMAIGKRDKLSHRHKTASKLWQSMLWGDGQTALVDPALDRHTYTRKPRYEQALFPGAFAPPHAGHRRMAEVVAKKRGKRVTLELSLTNVDKPRIDYLAIDDRLRAIADVFGDIEVWLTRLPTFQQKAQHFRDSTFIVGADTIVRIADPKYYDGDPAVRDAAIAEIADCGCRFLVFGRSVDGGFETLDDLDLPPALRSISDGVSEKEFREDVSSTEIRRGGHE